jgi:hypothetical protein
VMPRQTETNWSRRIRLRIRPILQTLAITVTFLVAASVMQPRQNPTKGFVFNSPIGEKTAIRFRYYPPGNYFHIPVIFRAVEQGNPRLDTVQLAVEGRVAFISFDEMSRLIQALVQSNLSWQESEKVEVFESFKQIESYPSSDIMDIKIVT